MSFITVIETELKADAQQAYDAAKVGVAYVEGVIVKDIAPQLLQAFLAALEKLGEEALTALLGNAASPAPTPAAPDSVPPGG